MITYAGNYSQTIRHIRCAGPQTVNFRIDSQSVLRRTVV